MATSTFDKRSVLGQKAAKRMAEALADPTLAKRPQKENCIPTMNDEETHKRLEEIISKSWGDIPVEQPEADEIEAVNQYLAGNPEYQPVITQDELLKDLGITM